LDDDKKKRKRNTNTHVPRDEKVAFVHITLKGMRRWPTAQITVKIADITDVNTRSLPITCTHSYCSHWQPQRPSWWKSLSWATTDCGADCASDNYNNWPLQLYKRHYGRELQ